MPQHSAPTARHDATEQTTVVRGRGLVIAWAGFAFGSTVSVAANVLAERIAPISALPTWTPSTQAEIGAAVWPIALLISVELLSRVSWPHGTQWLLARFGGAGAVALFSAFISYSHITAVLSQPDWAYGSLGAHVGPLVIDGIMAISGFALLAIARQNPQRVTAPIAPPVSVTDPAPEQAAAGRVEATPSPRTASVTTSSEPAPAKPPRKVSSLSESASRRDKMFEYLDTHPGATGAELDREFGTSNYGRTIVRTWNERNKQASGE